MTRRALISGLRLLLHLAMLAAVVALWNNDAPRFIYVAF
jgi:hypothetical protein